jgi:CCR4-NOT complex subunit CAF16
MSSSERHSICVFCGSSPGSKPEFVAVAEQLGQQVASETGWRLVYGGGNRGCMGSVAAAFCRADGDVLGVIPEAMTKNVPRGHPTTSAEGKGPQMIEFGKLGKGSFQTVTTPDMHSRKKRMAAESDLGFVALPGGFGTFEEVFEMVTWTQLGIHRKPIVLVNVAGFYDPLRAMVQKAISDEFIASAGANIISFVDEQDAKKEGGWGKAVVAEVKRANEQLAASGTKGYFDWSKSSSNEATNGTEGKFKVPTALRDTPEKELSVDVRELTFAFAAQQEPALEKCNLTLSRGSRCLLIGANGAGKSTILRLLAGKRMPTRGAHMRVFGRDVFHEAPGGITYLGTEWAMNPVVRSDIQVATFLDSVGGYRHKARRDELLDILDVDTNWRMHAISDGERRRVQLTMGLMEPWDVLLLDEVTVDLDVQVRADLLAFLSRETETRGATIIYATHIFDGLQEFPTHLVHMRHGRTTTPAPISWPPVGRAASNDEFEALPNVWKELEEGNTPPNLFETALAWLREDRVVRADEEARVKDAAHRRGARRGDAAATETDSERFFSKYDYNQIQAR